MNDKNDIRIIPSMIDAIIAGPVGHGPASLYAYDVWVNFPEGPRMVSGIKPSMERWSDSVDVIPILEKTIVPMGIIGGELQLMARELPHVTACNASSAVHGDLSGLIAAIKNASSTDRAKLREALNAQG